MLVVHGQRADGFHDLTSVMVPLAFGDRIGLREAADGADRLECDHPSVPLDENNLILRAANLFREQTGATTQFTFRLEKRIPVGAGLGGGSSNASAVLRGLNAWHGTPLDSSELTKLSAKLGSDCPFFIAARPALISGRGERIEPLGEGLASAMLGQRVLLLYPPFAIETGWAYRHLASDRANYAPIAESSARLRRFERTGDLGDLLLNSFERPVARKYLGLGALLGDLRGEGHRCLLSGSGSACFVLIDAGGAADPLVTRCREALGKEMFCVETSICQPEYERP